MVALSYNLLAYLDKLTSAGIPETQAKAQIEVLADAIKMNSEQTVKHHELKESETRLENKIDRLEATLSAKIDLVYAELSAKIDRVYTELKSEITSMKWLMGFMAAGITTLLIKAFFA